MSCWDNRCTLHRRDALDPNERLLHRAQIKDAKRMSAAAAGAQGMARSGGGKGMGASIPRFPKITAC